MDTATALFNRLVRSHLKQGLNEANKAHVMSWYTKKYLIDHGMVPQPPDPRTSEMKQQYEAMRRKLTCSNFE